jgi:hypothetical protein
MGKDVQGPIKIRFRRDTLEGPDGPSENAPPKVRIAQEGIFQNLLAVVVNKSVAQGAAKSHHGAQDEQPLRHYCVILQQIIATIQQNHPPLARTASP